MSDARAAAVIPTAAALIAAVRDRNPAAVAHALAGDIDWPALAVVLADNVGCIHDTRLLPQPRPRMRACRRCGTVGKRRGPLCRDCAQPSPDELVGGAWVPDQHGTSRWVAAS